jgi:hypothetical protein
VIGRVLAAETHTDLGLWIEGNSETRGIFGAKRLTQATNASRHGIAMVLRFGHRLKESIEHRSRWSEVGVNHREIEHLLPFDQHLMLKRFERTQVVPTKHRLNAHPTTTFRGATILGRTNEVL